ncbi:MAG: hypothetical protein ACTHLA_17185 [Asticcacaulis sp.]|uniref:hypothetical protein n=1 Tax=Asticcacaulis sp. TaxID=1872648 RepID=UPI003F7BF1E5
MGWLEFIATIVKALAWPIAAVVGFVLFRKSILTLLSSISKISHGETAINFDRQGKEVGASIVADQSTLPLPQLEAVASITTENIGKIVKTWSELEGIVRQRLITKGVDRAESLSGKPVIVAARHHNLITSDQANSLMGLLTMRNLAVHGREDEISDARTNEFLVLADAIKTVLEMTAGQQIAAGIVGQGELATMNVADLKGRI